MYNYYLKRMSENLIVSGSKSIQGKLQKEGLQYYLQRPVGDRYAVQLINIYGNGISRKDLGREYQALVVDDSNVKVPEGFEVYCYQLKEV